MLLTFVLLFALTGSHAEGVKTPYTEVVQSLMNQEWAQVTAFTLKCWTTPNQDFYMGIEQHLKIHAPFAQVKAVVENFDDYAALFPDYQKIKILTRAENHLTVYFEQKVPLFFIPNVKYEMLYTLLNALPDKAIYEYQLKDRGTLHGSDGFIALKKTGAENTDYTEYDFFDADWGAAKIAGKTKLWSDVVEGIYLSDLSLARKAENSELTAAQALALARKQMDRKLIETCVQDRAPWKSPAAPTPTPLK